MEPQENKKVNWKRLSITIGIVLVTALAIGGTTWYLMDQNAKKDKEASDKQAQELQKQIDAAKQTTTTIKPTEATDETANWKTYTDTKNGYTIKYPENLKPVTKEVPGKSYFGFETDGYQGKNSQPMIEVSFQNSILSPEEYAKTVLTESKVLSSRIFKTSDGLSGWLEKKTHMVVVWEAIYLSNSQKIANLHLNINDNVSDLDQTSAYNNETYVDTFEKMASTFKFTN